MIALVAAGAAADIASGIKSCVFILKCFSFYILNFFSIYHKSI